jgi:hypothetical protein
MAFRMERRAEVMLGAPGECGVSVCIRFVVAEEGPALCEC